MNLLAHITTLQNPTKSMPFPPSPFTGKERDEETGYGYFGARYMDHELMTMWLSVDPMADKYPSLSPYNYCAWNPIRLTDPDGDTIKINDFVYKAGMSSEKLNGFSKTAVDALNNIYNNGGDEGA
ncbi:MAG: RHS repeat-associated core domain-containing protein [Bacteroidales bacterium]|nr:RHS repeat-associated core domain-containing protein [Bacteroidales bacterium]